MMKSERVSFAGPGVLPSVLAVVVGIATLGCTADGPIGVSQERKVNPPENELCRVTGGGRILADDSPDSFGGNAQPFRTDIDGEWNHVTHEGDHFHGDPAFIDCFDVEGDEARPPRAPTNAIEFGGTGRWNDEEDCSFFVHIEDHGEPGTSDVYRIDIWCTSGASYSAGDTLLDGNLQIHEVPPGHQG